MSRALYLPENVSKVDQLKETLSQLPENLVSLNPVWCRVTSGTSTLIWNNLKKKGFSSWKWIKCFQYILSLPSALWQSTLKSELLENGLKTPARSFPQIKWGINVLIINFVTQLDYWFTNLEQTPLNRCQQLHVPATYKRLIHDINITNEPNRTT